MSQHSRAKIFAIVRYRDVEAAIQWLTETFGFKVKSVLRNDQGAVQHAELELEGDLIMVGQHDGEGFLGGTTPDARASTGSTYVVLADVGSHYAHASAGDAEMVREVTEQAFGGREYIARDLEGNLWTFGSYDPNVTEGEA